MKSEHEIPEFKCLLGFIGRMLNWKERTAVASQGERCKGASGWAEGTGFQAKRSTTFPRKFFHPDGWHKDWHPHRPPSLAFRNVDDGWFLSRPVRTTCYTLSFSPGICTKWENCSPLVALTCHYTPIIITSQDSNARTIFRAGKII